METNYQTGPQAQPNAGAAMGTAPVVTPESETHRKKASTAMVLSIIGLSLFILPGLNLVGLVLSIIGLVQSCGNRRFAADHGLEEDGMNKTGFICGLIGVIAGGLSALATLFLLLFVGITAVSLFSSVIPHMSESVTEAMPYIQDAIEEQLPGALNMIFPFLMGL